MSIQSTAPTPFFPSGSYYCRYLGCEKRLGVEILSKGANHRILHVIEDKLIEKNRGRDATVVWIGERPTSDTSKTRVELCGREPERSKQALELLKADLAGEDWVGELAVVEELQKDCLWDVRLYVKDDVQAPVKPRR
jgi:hypothetical protein